MTTHAHDRPNDTDKCARCSHTFSQHYQTYGRQYGCSDYVGQYNNESRCSCVGFAIIYKDTGNYSGPG